MHRLLLRLLPLACAAGAATPLAAAELSPQERLEAVRQELIQATLQGATQVRSTAWIDGTGALRESSSFRHGMQVRGVRVLAYQRDDAGQPRAQVQWQGREDLLKPAATATAAARQPAAAAAAPACSAERRLQHVLGWSLAIDARGPLDTARLLQEAGDGLARQWLQAGAAAPAPQAWRLLEAALPADPRAPVPGSAEAYQRLLTGGPVPLAPGWVARLRLEAGPPPAAPVQARLPWPLPADKAPALLPLRLSLAVSPSEGGAVLYESWVDLALPVEQPAWGPPRLGADAAPRLAALVAGWARTLDERLACQPVQVQVLQARGDRLEVDQGSLAGLRPGQEWLVSDRQQVPQRLLDPGAADKLVLARVESVGPQRAELKVLAGAAEQVRARWQAWPMQAP